MSGRNADRPELVRHTVESRRLIGKSRLAPMNTRSTDCLADSFFYVLYVTQQCLRAINRPSEQDFDRTATEKALKSALRPAGRPISVLRSSPAKIRPGRPISEPEALLRNTE